VWQEPIDASAGASQYVWDGRDSDGNVVNEGEYLVSIEATDAEGNRLPVDTYVRGQVDSVRFDNGYPELVVGGRRLKMSDVTEVN
jgi:flagellar basal-body rod modification protein FlgD